MNVVDSEDKPCRKPSICFCMYARQFTPSAACLTRHYTAVCMPAHVISCMHQLSLLSCASVNSTGFEQAADLPSSSSDIHYVLIMLMRLTCLLPPAQCHCIQFRPSEIAPQCIAQVQFSPDGRWIATASFDKAVKLWDGVRGAFVATLRAHVGPVYQLAWSSDSRLLVSASKDSTLKASSLLLPLECVLVRCTHCK